MTSDKFKAWLIALLSADTRVSAALPSPRIVESGGDNLPSDTGVYVGIIGEAPGTRPTDTVHARIACVHRGGEAACYTLLEAVVRALHHRPGEASVWQVAPGPYGLSVKSLVRRQTYGPASEGPDAAAPGMGLYVATLPIDAVARDRSMPS